MRSMLFARCEQTLFNQRMHAPVERCSKRVYSINGCYLSLSDGSSDEKNGVAPLCHFRGNGHLHLGSVLSLYRIQRSEV